MDITIHDIPIELHQALTLRATAEKSSVAKALVEAAAEQLGVKLPKGAEDAPLEKPKKFRDLSFLTEGPPLEPEVVQALEGQRTNELPSDASGKVTPKKYRDLSDIAGTWVEDPEFDAILAEQRRIDPELWK